MPTAPEEMTLKVIAHIHTAFPTNDYEKNGSYRNQTLY